MIFLFLIVIILGVSFGFIYWQVQQSAAMTTPAEVLAYHAEERKYFEGIHSPTIAELSEVLRGHGFDDVATAVEAAGKPCFRLVPSAEEDASPRSRVGGLPDLPDITRWPQWNGVPLAFLAQIDLGELAELNPDAPLPKSGLLSFVLRSPMPLLLQRNKGKAILLMLFIYSLSSLEFLLQILLYSSI